MDDCQKAVDGFLNAATPDDKLTSLSLLETYFDQNILLYALLNSSRIDPFITSVANLLKSNQPKLSLASLTIFNSLFDSLFYSSESNSLVQDSVTFLKSSSNVFIPILVERFSEQKEKIRELSTSSLFHITFRFSTFKGKSSALESSILILDTQIKNNGFESKIPRAREQLLPQACSWLSNCFQNISEFPVRQFIHNLVKLLEDSNDAVRAASKETLALIFSKTTDHGRSDIKKELTKQKIRQSIVESILELSVLETNLLVEDKCMNTSITSQPKEIPSRIPRGKATEFVDIDSSPIQASIPESKIEFTSPKDIEISVNNIVSSFTEKETEQTWQNRDKLIIQLKDLIPAIFSTENSSQLENPIKSSLLSLRSAVVANACRVISDLAINLGSKLDPLTDFLLINLVTVTKSANKVMQNSSVTASIDILTRCSFSLRHLSILQNIMESEKNQIARGHICSFVQKIVERITDCDSNKAVLEKLNESKISGLDIIEKLLIKGLDDSSEQARNASRQAYLHIQEGWPERAEKILGGLSIGRQRAIQKLKPISKKKSSKSLPQIPTPPPILKPLPSAEPDIKNFKNILQNDKKQKNQPPATPLNKSLTLNSTQTLATPRTMMKSRVPQSVNRIPSRKSSLEEVSIGAIRKSSLENVSIASFRKASLEEVNYMASRNPLIENLSFGSHSVKGNGKLPSVSIDSEVSFETESHTSVDLKNSSSPLVSIQSNEILDGISQIDIINHKVNDETLFMKESNEISMECEQESLESEKIKNDNVSAMDVIDESVSDVLNETLPDGFEDLTTSRNASFLIAMDHESVNMSPQKPEIDYRSTSILTERASDTFLNRPFSSTSPARMANFRNNLSPSRMYITSPSARRHVDSSNISKTKLNWPSRFDSDLSSQRKNGPVEFLDPVSWLERLKKSEEKSMLTLFLRKIIDKE
ncbi:suppressor of tub2 mutation [Nowakowskiella sp. JEL0078]|nr:suppressor of tub2 mutation [Nowakowskiella sp. JEL0078]